MIDIFTATVAGAPSDGASDSTCWIVAEPRSAPSLATIGKRLPTSTSDGVVGPRPATGASADVLSEALAGEELSDSSEDEAPELSDSEPSALFDAELVEDELSTERDGEALSESGASRAIAIRDAGSVVSESTAGSDPPMPHSARTSCIDTVQKLTCGHKADWMSMSRTRVETA